MNSMKKSVLRISEISSMSCCSRVIASVPQRSSLEANVRIGSDVPNVLLRNRLQVKFMALQGTAARNTETVAGGLVYRTRRQRIEAVSTRNHTRVNNGLRNFENIIAAVFSPL